MKLINKFILVYLIVSLVAFGIGGVVIYSIFTDEIDEETNYELNRTVRYLRDMITKGVPYDTLEQGKIKIRIVPNPGELLDTLIHSDTMAYHIHSDDVILQRKIDAYQTIRDTTYHISAYETLIEPEDTQSGATRSVLILFLLLTIMSLVLSFFISTWLLHPFHQSLVEMKNFSIQKSEPIHLPSSTTKEFNNLNKFINQMTTKAITDYKNLKEFSENLAHEIGTPLAIANGKLDLLM